MTSSQPKAALPNVEVGGLTGRFAARCNGSYVPTASHYGGRPVWQNTKSVGQSCYVYFSKPKRQWFIGRHAEHYGSVASLQSSPALPGGQFGNVKVRLLPATPADGVAHLELLSNQVRCSTSSGSQLGPNVTCTAEVLNHSKHGMPVNFEKGWIMYPQDCSTSPVVSQGSSKPVWAAPGTTTPLSFIAIARDGSLKRPEDSAMLASSAQLVAPEAWGQMPEVSEQMRKLEIENHALSEAKGLSLKEFSNVNADNSALRGVIETSREQLQRCEAERESLRAAKELSVEQLRALKGNTEVFRSAVEERFDKLERDNQAVQVALDLSSGRNHALQTECKRFKAAEASALDRLGKTEADNLALEAAANSSMKQLKRSETEKSSLQRAGDQTREQLRKVSADNEALHEVQRSSSYRLKELEESQRWWKKARYQEVQAERWCNAVYVVGLGVGGLALEWCSSRAILGRYSDLRPQQAQALAKWSVPMYLSSCGGIHCLIFASYGRHRMPWAQLCCGALLLGMPLLLKTRIASAGRQCWLDVDHACRVSDVAEDLLIEIDCPGVARQDVQVEVRAESCVVSVSKRSIDNSTPRTWRKTFTLGQDSGHGFDFRAEEMSLDLGVLRLVFRKSPASRVVHFPEYFSLADTDADCSWCFPSNDSDEHPLDLIVVDDVFSEDRSLAAASSDVRVDGSSPPLSWCVALDAGVDN